MINSNNNNNVSGPISQQSNGSRSVFARIMSTENITVLFDPKSKDAWFDTKTRTLMMPNWTGMTPEVYDLLLSHEVSHALHTPAGGWLNTVDELVGTNASDEDKQVARQYLNIIEDTRIERLIKQKYPGLARDYMKGYEWMVSNDVFGDIGNTDLSSFNFIDRINLHFKIGHHANFNIPFSKDEQDIVDMISTAQSFDDVAKITRLVWDHANGQAQSNKKKPKTSGGGGDGDDGDGDDQNGNGEENDSESNNKNSKQGNLNKIASKTAANQDKFLNKNREVNKYGGSEDNPCVLPDYDLKQIVVPSSKISEQMDDALKDCVKCSDWISAARGEFSNFISEAKPTVDAMVKAFLLKKAASAHHRQQQAKTGTLDCNLLSTYKWNEDLFKHFTVKPNGKNHGFIVHLDWSGSMGGLVLNVVKQMYILTSFFRKIGVPYDVYAFSSHKPSSKYYSEYGEYYREFSENKPDQEDRFPHILNTKDPRCAVSNEFYLYHFASSTHNSATHKDMMEKLWFLAFSMSANNWDISSMYCPIMPHWLSLGDTPLDHALIASNKLVEDFQRKNRVEIMNVVVITDGCTSSSPVQGHYYGSRYMYSRVVNPKTNASYPLKGMVSTNVLAEYLQDNTGCNAMMLYLSIGNTPSDVVPGYKVCTPDMKYIRSESKNYLRDDPANDGLQEHWSEHNYLMAIPCTTDYTGIAIPEIGFNTVFAIKIPRKDKEDLYQELDMSNTTYARLKSQFVKSLSRKIVNRSLVNRMVEVVAKHT